MYEMEEASIMNDNDMWLDNFLLYYGRIMLELDAMQEKVKNHFGVRPDDVGCSALHKARRTAEILRYVNRLWEGTNYDDV